MTTDITVFDGEYRFLSNFHMAPTHYENTVYPSAEHAYQAAKFPRSLRKVFEQGSPGQAKRHGRRPGM